MPLPTSPPPSRPPGQLVGLFLALVAVLVTAGILHQLRLLATNHQRWAHELATIAKLKVRQVDFRRQDLVRDGQALAYNPGLARFAAKEKKKVPRRRVPQKGTRPEKGYQARCTAIVEHFMSSSWPARGPSG